MKTVFAKFLLRRGNSFDWIEQNPTLAAGEPGIEIDTNKIKIGDGVQTWSELDYIGKEFKVHFIKTNTGDINCLENFDSIINAINDNKIVYAEFLNETISDFYSLVYCNEETICFASQQIDSNLLINISSLELSADNIVSNHSVTLEKESVLSDSDSKIPTSKAVFDAIKEIGGGKNAYSSINQISDYLFETKYNSTNIDYDFANNYFKSLTEPVVKEGFCTGVVKDGKVLRHFDWFYDDNCEFIVRRPADPERNIHASFGTSAALQGFSKAFVESGAYSEKYKLVPFSMVDGINDAGLYVQTNVVNQLEEGFDLNPEAQEECCIFMAVRYILDHCANFEEVENFFNTVHIYSSNALPFGFHFLVAQNNDWEIIEITPTGHVTVTQGTEENQMPHGIMTNFRTTGLRFDDDNIDWSSIETYGDGVERYEIATKAFTENLPLEDLRNALKYTTLYTDLQTNTRWNTEYCGEEYEGNRLTVMDAKNNPQYFDDIFNLGVQAYEARTRTENPARTWQTVHSSIFDLKNKTFNIAIQERMDKTFNFSLDDNKAINYWESF